MLRSSPTLMDGELNALLARLMAFGGLAESQTRLAAAAVASRSTGACEEILGAESRLNALEREIDHDLASLMGRCQPKAGDLRLLLAMSKAVPNLERVGDEAVKLVRAACTAAPDALERAEGPEGDLGVGAQLASVELARALDAFARQDARAAVAILKADGALDLWFREFVGTLGQAMQRAPRTVAHGVGLLLAAKACERIGDHAKNIAELVIYSVQGEDVRHMEIAAVELLVT